MAISSKHNHIIQTKFAHCLRIRYSHASNNSMITMTFWPSDRVLQLACTSST